MFPRKRIKVIIIAKISVSKMEIRLDKSNSPMESPCGKIASKAKPGEIQNINIFIRAKDIATEAVEITLN